MSNITQDRVAELLTSLGGQSAAFKEARLQGIEIYLKERDIGGYEVAVAALEKHVAQYAEQVAAWQKDQQKIVSLQDHQSEPDPLQYAVRPHRKEEMEALWPPSMTLSEIAAGTDTYWPEDSFLRECRAIYYSGRTSNWEKSFAKENASKYIWRAEHFWIVPPDQIPASEPVRAQVKKILFDRGLSGIEWSGYEALANAR